MVCKFWLVSVENALEITYANNENVIQIGICGRMDRTNDAYSPTTMASSNGIWHIKKRKFIELNMYFFDDGVFRWELFSINCDWWPISMNQYTFKPVFENVDKIKSRISK